MSAIVISMGGSVLLSPEADETFLTKLADLFTTVSVQHKLYIIVGGGSTARTYIQLGRRLNFDEETLDQMGIHITRINAELLAHLLKISNNIIPHTTKEAANLNFPIVVMGGTTPGHSTDMVGAELAQQVNATLFVIATNVDGVYDKDPNKFKDAKQLTEVTIEDLINQFGTDWKTAGKNTAIDGPALAIIQKAKIPTVVVNGKRLDQLTNVLQQKPFDGTTIIP